MRFLMFNKKNFANILVQFHKMFLFITHNNIIITYNNIILFNEFLINFYFKLFLF